MRDALETADDTVEDRSDRTQKHGVDVPYPLNNLGADDLLILINASETARATSLLALVTKGGPVRLPSSLGHSVPW